MDGLVNSVNGVVENVEKLIIDTDPGIGLFHLFYIWIVNLEFKWNWFDFCVNFD